MIKAWFHALAVFMLFGAPTAMGQTASPPVRVAVDPAREPSPESYGALRFSRDQAQRDLFEQRLMEARDGRDASTCRWEVRRYDMRFAWASMAANAQSIAEWNEALGQVTGGQAEVMAGGVSESVRAQQLTIAKAEAPPEERDRIDMLIWSERWRGADQPGNRWNRLARASWPNFVAATSRAMDCNIASANARALAFPDQPSSVRFRSLLSPSAELDRRTLEYLDRQLGDGARRRNSLVAELVDRVAVADGRPQTYATVLQCESGTWRAIGGVVDPATLEDRRTQVGLSPSSVGASCP